MTLDIRTTNHPFLTGKPKRMLIDGKWLEAASGKTFETINPSTGELLATVAKSDAEARRAFDGPWRKIKPFEGSMQSNQVPGYAAEVRPA